MFVPVTRLPGRLAGGRRRARDRAILPPRTVSSFLDRIRAILRPGHPQPLDRGTGAEGITPRAVAPVARAAPPSPVVSACEAFLTAQVGAVVARHAAGSLAHAWPGGGFVTMRADALEGAPLVHATVGLTAMRPDAARRDAHANSEPDARDEPGAGAGYEMLVVTHDAGAWPLPLLQWCASAELLAGAGLLARVESLGALSVEGIDVGDGAVHVVITKARPPLPASTVLPTGRMTLLVATIVTDAELAWAQQHGRKRLVMALVRAGIGQRSDRTRESVLT